MRQLISSLIFGLSFVFEEHAANELGWLHSEGRVVNRRDLETPRPETHLGNKSDPLGVYLARRSNTYESEKCHHALDTFGTPQSSP